MFTRIKYLIAGAVATALVGTGLVATADGNDPTPSAAVSASESPSVEESASSSPEPSESATGPSASASASETPSESPSPSVTPTPTPTPTDPPSAKNESNKVVVFVIENHSVAQVKAKMPRVWKYGQTYGNATNMRAITHPSQPNYIAMWSGVVGKTRNRVVTLKQPDIGNNTISAGRTMKVYVDGLPKTYAAKRKDKGVYAARHVPTVPFVATPQKKANFNKYTVHANELGGYGVADIDDGTLPNVGAIIPNDAHNWHDGSAATADKWIAGKIDLMLKGDDWKSGKLTIVVTADEDDKNGVNDIVGIVLHPSLKHKIVTKKLTLYSLGGFLADHGHTPRLGKQKTDADFAKAFGIKVI